MFKVRTHAIALTLLLALLSSTAAGCAPAPAPASIPTATPVAPTATATTAPTDTPIPTATETPFVPKATVKIVSQSPEYSDIAEGAQLAVEQLAGALRDLGYKAEYVAYDDQDNVDVAAKNAGEIIDDPEVLCGVGHYTSRVTINLEDLYHRAALAFISPSATNPQVTGRHYLEISRVASRDDGLAAAAVQFIQSKGMESFFLVRNNVDFFNRVGNEFRRGADAAHITILGDLPASIEMGNFEAVITHVMDAKPDVVLFGGSANQAGTFFHQARLAGYEGMLIAIDGADALGQNAGPLGLEGGGLYYMAGSVPPQVFAGTQQFSTDFQLAFSAAPQLLGYGAEAYDAAGICLRAIEEASKTKGGELPTRQDVAQAVRLIQSYPGLTGTFSFNEDGDPVVARYLVIQVASVDPNNWARNPIASEFELPPPK